MAITLFAQTEIISAHQGCPCLPVFTAALTVFAWFAANTHTETDRHKDQCSPAANGAGAGGLAIMHI